MVLGALEVGLKGALGVDLVDGLLGSWPMLVRVLYVLVGAAGVWGAYAMLTKKK